MADLLKTYAGSLAMAMTAWTASAGNASASVFGEEVINVATVSYTLGERTTTVRTNEAIFTIEAPRVPATIEFFRHSPNASDPSFVTINGSDYSPSGAIDGPFTNIGPARTTGGRTVDISNDVPLIPAFTYLAGELMFIRVGDTGRNINSNAIDTVAVTIEADNGDLITLQLYESGPDTGEFWAYMPSTRVTSPVNDPEIQTGENTQLKATYVDIFDSTDVVIDSALVDPVNRVFSSVTGEAVDGAVVTLMDMTTSQPAKVFGVDAFSAFPASMTSGAGVEDASGLFYELNPGEFRYPNVDEGQYAIRVGPPEGFTFSSVLDPNSFEAFEDGSFVITDASYGLQFANNEFGPLRFDIPLDPQSDLIVSKSADQTFGDVGDFINYTVVIENRGQVAAPIELYDTLPMGFRYIPGTARRANIPMDDPEVAPTATLLTFPMGTLSAGDSISLSYALEIGAGATFGDAVNEAVVRNGNGEQISNIARAGVTLREDLLRSTSTIVGRVSQNSCDGDEDWARDIVRGDGVAGVRIYTETGAYAVSDADGLFHFEGVTEGTHVVQVDEETLPQGFEPMVCEENTRYAGSATSKFVDVQGGGIWRANFYLKQTGETKAIEDVKVSNAFDEQNSYDLEWLETQSSDIAWVYPDTTKTPALPSVNLGIKHSVGQKVKLVLNGNTVSNLNMAARDTNRARTVMLSRWRGVDLLDGNNVITATITNADGSVAKVLRKDVAFVRTIARATPVVDQSELIADGITTPEIAIRLEDEAGRAVHAGRIARIDVKAPYLLYGEAGDVKEFERDSQLISPLSARNDMKVGADGILRVPLEPTLRTGKVTVIVTLDNGRKVPVYMYLEPEKRDWIVVGLAEGTVGLENIKNNGIDLGDSDDVITDGRVAFFAKGLIKGNWLMTLAVDTDKRKGDRDGDFLGEIDPNAYYTLYGDRSYQQYEGVSRYPVYVKLEKSTAYAMFGDYDTNITEGRLTAYNRRLSGLKAEYLGDKFQVLGFAAETNQGFAKDELVADGTSGTYQLSNTRILAQSEEITIETRDRNRPDIILDRKVLIRYLDYTLDYLTGELIFRLPVDVSDANFNPNVIVADYETSEDAERNITFGGRVQTQLMDGKVQIGSTFVHENGSALTSGSKQNMIGADIVAQITDNTEVRAEYAVTEDKGAVDGGTSEAMLAEVIHTSENLSTQAYFRQEDGGFGLGQRNSNTNSVRRYGVSADYKFDEFEDKETGRRGHRSVEATAYREDNLSTGNSRNTGEVLATHKGDRLSVSGGLRASEDKLVGRDDRKSVLAIATASLSVPKHGATFQISREQPLGGKDEVTNFPARTTLGVDKTIGSRATATIRHEILDGANASGQNTVVGLSTTPWDGTVITASSDLLTNDSGRRLGATVGVDQQVRLTDQWSLSAGVRNRKVLDQNGTYVEVAPDAAISPLETNEDFTSAYLGAAYRTDVMSGSARLEARNASDGDTWTATAGVARELSEELSIAGAARGFFREAKDPIIAPASSQVDVRLGAAWRPRDEDVIIFDRLDISKEKKTTGEISTKVVNNLATNVMVSDRWQLAGNYGVKHVSADIAGQTYKSWSHLLGAETRFDITEKIDVGLRGSMLKSTSTNTMEYSWGPSIGVSPVDNVWISAGYNVKGFVDDDFEAAEHSREGIYIQMRLKFDQDTARSLLRRISPSSTVGPNADQRSFGSP